MCTLFSYSIFYVHLPLKMVDCLDIFARLLFSYMLFVEKMLLRLSFFFTLRCFIMLTVKSTPRGLVFTRYVSAHTSVREQQQLQNMTTAGCFMDHINAKIKNGIQRFINIAILSESNIRNSSGVMWTTTVYFLYLTYKYIER